MYRRPKMSVFFPGSNDVGTRLDKLLRKLFPELKLAEIYSSIRKKKVLVNGKKSEISYRIQGGDRIEWLINRVNNEPPCLNCTEVLQSRVQPFDNLQLLKEYLIYADKDFLFLNKPRGMLCHGEDSLGNLVTHALAGTIHESLSFSPGPLHRLDRNTSGLVAFSRSIDGARRFQQCLANAGIAKWYIGLFEGAITKGGLWSDSISRSSRSRTSKVDPAGKPALLHFTPIIATARFTFGLIQLISGLTHQIRVQAHARGHPLVGDKKYGSDIEQLPYFLHSFALCLPHDLFLELPRSIIAQPGEDILDSVSRYCNMSIEKIKSDVLEFAQQSVCAQK